MKKNIINKIANACEGSVAIAILLVIGTLALCFGGLCLKAWIVMLLWNWIAVALFGLSVINFWLAFGLCLLCALLFKGKTTVKNSND